MKIVEIPVGAVGLDMLAPLSADKAAEMASTALQGTRTYPMFFERYVENLTRGELDGILATNSGVILVGESRGEGWIPSADFGAMDGERVVSKRKALDAPPGVTIVCDLEGMGGGPVEAIAYVNAWCRVVQAEDADCGYVGAGVPLTPSQLYALPFRLYYRSLSNVQPVAACDYSILQAYPTIEHCGVEVDVDFVQRDKKGRLPRMIVSDDWAGP